MTTPLSDFQKLQVAKAQAQSTQAIANEAARQAQALDPQGRFTKQVQDARTAAETFVSKEQIEFTREKEAIENTLKAIDIAENAKKPLDRYKQTLVEKKTHYDKENKELEQKIRANRRRFLDNDPQAGVLSVFGQKTNDDKVMLGFWAALLLFVNTMIFTILTYMEKQHIPAIYGGINAGVILLVLLVLYYFG